jgi:microcystin-dependent protein
MADPFVAEIRIFTFNFAPKGWAFCDGQLMAIMQNTALFSLLGTTYGGDGKSTFSLPNLQGRVAIHQGQGPGLSLRDLGEEGGEASVTLIASELAPHNHPVNASGVSANKLSPGGNFPAASLPATQPRYVTAAVAPVQMAAGMISGGGGGGQPHENRQPYLALNFCIAMQGVFPPRW